MSSRLTARAPGAIRGEIINPRSGMSEKNKTPSFEDNLAKLEEIVSSLEEGETTLNESLEAFEQGIKLSRLCHAELEKAERKVELLIKKDGEVRGRKELEG